MRRLVFVLVGVKFEGVVSCETCGSWCVVRNSAKKKEESSVVQPSDELKKYKFTRKEMISFLPFFDLLFIDLRDSSHSDVVDFMAQPQTQSCVGAMPNVFFFCHLLFFHGVLVDASVLH